MRRDELMRQIASLPEHVDIGVQIAGERLDITGFTDWGDGRFIAIRCDRNDLQDVLAGWGVPPDRRGEFLRNEA